MPEIRIRVRYTPNLDHYPVGVVSTTDAMHCDIRSLNEGLFTFDEFFEGCLDRGGSVDFDVIEED